jgi:diguanylate cyclase (GGDEF)-like protein
LPSFDHILPSHRIRRISSARAAVSLIFSGVVGDVEEKPPVEEDDRKRRSNLIDWPELDRALALLGFCLLYSVIAAFTLAALPNTTAAPYLDPEILELSFTMNTAVGVFWVGLFGLGMYARRNQRPYRYILWLLAISYALFFSTVIYILGLYTTPLWLMLAAGLMMALLLLDRVIVHSGGLIAAFALMLLSVGEQTRVLPHAPLFKHPPYTPTGALDPTWNAAMTFASWLLLLIIWGIGDNLMTRWREREESLKKLSTIDALTGLANRRHFMEVMRRECRRAERTDRPLSLLMFDADHFKQVNDDHGHGVGDEVLVGLAQVLAEGVREFTDLVGRLGGEEFAVLLPDADLSVAISVAERIRKAAEARVFEAEGTKFSVTFSVGAASSSSVGTDPTSLLHVADVMLYRSKKSGRNRVSWNEAA